MSPLNRGPLLGPRMQPVRPPMPRFHGGRLPPMPGMPPRMPPPMGPMFGPMRQRMMPPRPGIMMRPVGPPPPLFGPRGRGVPPLMPPMMGPRAMGPRGLGIRPPLRGPPPQGLPHPRPRFPTANVALKGKIIYNVKKIYKLEELELKKPWMTDEIRAEIQKKNKLYVKAKKNKDAKEWDEFKDLRNKVTRMIRDAKNEYLAKHPEQAHVHQGDEEDQPYDQRDENYASSDEETSYYCEVCDREFFTAILLERHEATHKTCGIDGCVFTAHPKLVEKHISMQHCTGLYRRMKNISTPEDIQNWIAERKKKYPTKSNIDRKDAETTEKRQRGEIIGAKQSPAAVKFDEKTRRPKRRKLRKCRIENSQPEPLEILYRGLRPFAGIANLSEDTNGGNVDLEVVEEFESATLPMDVACDISDDEDRTTRLPVNPTVIDDPIPKQLGLTCLVANYGSDTSEDEGPIEVPIKKIQLDVPADDQSSKISNSIPDKIPEQSNAPEIRDDESNAGKNSKWAKNARKDRPTENGTNEKNRSVTAKNVEKIRHRKHLMLLQRLLSRSMQHERNLICQCIKYISDNDFFQ